MRFYNVFACLHSGQSLLYGNKKSGPAHIPETAEQFIYMLRTDSLRVSVMPMRIIVERAPYPIA